jgi:biopolymer transport protein ExbD
MKLSAKKLDRKKDFELNMTSMIDCVFLLLIFFMVTMSFIRTEKNLDSGIKVNSAAASSASDFEPAIVRVTRSKSGGAFVFQVGERELTDFEELQQLMRQFDQKENGAHVLVSDDAPYGMAAQALQACKSANFPIVSYIPASGASSAGGN